LPDLKYRVTSQCLTTGISRHSHKPYRQCLHMHEYSQPIASFQILATLGKDPAMRRPCKGHRRCSMFIASGSTTLPNPYTTPPARRGVVRATTIRQGRGCCFPNTSSLMGILPTLKVKRLASACVGSSDYPPSPSPLSSSLAVPPATTAAVAFFLPTLPPEARRLWSIRSRLFLPASAVHSYAVARALRW
jgi:hypothetical protein